MTLDLYCFTYNINYYIFQNFTDSIGRRMLLCGLLFSFAFLTKCSPVTFQSLMKDYNGEED